MPDGSVGGRRYPSRGRRKGSAAPIRVLPPICEPMSEADRQEVVKLLSELFTSHFRRKANEGGGNGEVQEGNERTPTSE